jgi:RNA polymerase sigma-70 factor (ECF subfamily)
MTFSATLDAARNGSAPALGAILESCQGYVRAIATRQLPRKLRGRVSPSSLVQETYLRACRHFGQFRGRSERQLLLWLRRIMLHCLLNLLRTAEFRTPLGALPAHLGGRSAAPAQQAADLECGRALSLALDCLPAHYRLVIELRHFDRLPFEEVGALLGCSAEAARKVWARAQARLGQELQRFQ